MNDLILVGEEALKLVGAGWTLQKLIGPTLDYFGGSMRNVVERRASNVTRILENAARKLGNPDALAAGEVSPRVIRDVFEDGSLIDDELAAEYFGGLVAADRLAENGDDQVAIWTQLVARLSTRAIRTHYILYRSAHECLADSGINFGSSPPVGGDPSVYVPWSTYASGLGTGTTITEPEWDLWAETMYMLTQESLLPSKDHGGWSLNSATGIQQKFPLAPEPGAIFRPSYSGVRLFILAHGLPIRNNEFTYASFTLSEDIDIPPPVGSRRAKDLKVVKATPPSEV